MHPAPTADKARAVQHYQALAAEAQQHRLADNYSRTGALSHRRVDLCTARWGGGAEPGCYHVFLAGASRLWSLGMACSVQCVVDDFGNLVRAQ